MCSLEECKRQLTAYKKTRGEILGIQRIGVFGSVARGEQTPESDIDVVVDVASPSLYIMFTIHDELTAIFRNKVDVVRMRDTLRPLLKRNIEKEAIYV